MNKTCVLVTGACGQIGTLLSAQLQEMYGFEQVIVSDIRSTATFPCVYEQLDVTDSNKLFYLISKYQVTEIYHLAAILSAKGEANPIFTWNINMNGLLNVLEAAKNYQLDKVFYPSTIAVFGLGIDKNHTIQWSNLTPETVYGISKAAGENWCNYYHKKHGVDVRSIRYPGIISWDTLPGGGTTDYAVEIFHEAIKNGRYESYIDKDTVLPMMYMPDALRATIDIMQAPAENIKIRTSYNLSAMSFDPKSLANEIKKHLPDFEISYAPDFRQEIAAGWPAVIDDTEAREHWGWKESYNLSDMCTDIITQMNNQKK